MREKQRKVKRSQEKGFSDEEQGRRTAPKCQVIEFDFAN